MTAIDRLIENYARQVRLPWTTGMAGKQKVWFAVYPPPEERRLRAKLPQAEAATLEAGHGWLQVDLTRLLPEWLGAHEYREGIFEEPEHFTADGEIQAEAGRVVREICLRDEVDENCVVAVTGLAALFDFISVSQLIDHVEDCVRGRLLVFFPGEFHRNIYRFMDARDGFNYMAIPITTAESFLNR